MTLCKLCVGDALLIRAPNRCGFVLAQTVYASGKSGLLVVFNQQILGPRRRVGYIARGRQVDSWRAARSDKIDRMIARNRHNQEIGLSCEVAYRSALDHIFT